MFLLERIIDILTLFRCRLVKTMRFKAADMRLIVPLCGTRPRRSEIPQTELCRPKPLPVDRPACQTPFAFPRPLIEITVRHGFKGMRLMDHLRNGAKSHKVGTVCPDAIDSDISDHKHTLHALAFSLRSQKSCQKTDIFRRSLNDCHF